MTESPSRKAVVRCVMEVSLLCTAICASHILNEAVARCTGAAPSCVRVCDSRNRQTILQGLK